MDSGKLDAGGIDRLRAALQCINDVLGVLDLEEKNLNAYARALIRKRDQARKQGDWQQADNLRTNLLNCGILVFDSPVGAIWERISEQSRPS
jgi:cysteinyl-tRNA synthetase